MPKKLTRSNLEKKLDKLWSEYVRKRDNCNCQKCKKVYGQSVSPHHAFGRRHRAVRWDVDNGVSLCYFCHIQWAHRDSAGFTEWFKNHVGEDVYNRLAEAHNEIFKPTMDELRQMVSDLEGMISDDE